MVFDAFTDSKPATAKSGIDGGLLLAQADKTPTDKSMPQWTPVPREPSKNEIERNREIDAIFSPDKRMRSGTSMQMAIDGLQKMGESSENKLAFSTRQSLGKAFDAYQQSLPADELRARRESIANLTAYGSLLMDGKVNQTASFTDKNIDLGGNAFSQFLMAKAQIKRNDQLVDQLTGKFIDGKPVNAKEKSDLDLYQVEKLIDSKLAAIEGEHDVEGVKNDLKSFLRPTFIWPIPGLDDSARDSKRAQLYKSREHKFDTEFLRTPDYRIDMVKRNVESKGIAPEQDPLASRIISKMLRDQALASIAEAELKMEEGDLPTASDIMFGSRAHPANYRHLDRYPHPVGVANTLDLAQKFGPNNLDLPKLKKMSDEITTKMASKGYPIKQIRIDPFYAPKP